LKLLHQIKNPTPTTMGSVPDPKIYEVDQLF